MHHVALVALFVAGLLSPSAAEVSVTPAIETEEGNMKLRLDANKTISFQFGPDAADTIDVRDPHEPTIKALALGYRYVHIARI